mgnify:CR=1 FL=1
MAFIIEDGTGSGRTAGVSDDNRLLTESIGLTFLDYRTSLGQAYNIHTDTLTLTNAVEDGILYIKNDRANSIMLVSDILLGVGKGTVGTGDVIFKVYANPTGGTLLSAGTAVTPENRNLGSKLPAQLTALKMASVGQTITGGSLLSGRVMQDASRIDIGAGWVLPTGSSVAMSVTPPASNTSMRAMIVATVAFLS